MKPGKREKIAAALRAEIRAGEYAKGSRLPGVEELCERFDVSTATAVYGVGILVDEGLVTARQGRGYFVADYDDEGGLRQDLESAKEALDDAVRALLHARNRIDAAIRASEK